MDTMILATKNKGKIKEINRMLDHLEYKFISMEEAGIDLNVVEDGVTFEENAIKKAKEVMRVSGKVALSDDSGLEVDYLDKAPGVYSARFLGEETSYKVKNQHILEKLKGVPEKKRTARFVCVVAVAFPNGDILTSRGVIEGIIGHAQQGSNGFGYDPIFYVPKYRCTTADMPFELKDSISHRGQALKAMKQQIKGYMKK